MNRDPTTGNRYPDAPRTGYRLPATGYLQIVSCIVVAVALGALCLQLRWPWATTVGERGDMRLFAEWAQTGGSLRAGGESLGELYVRRPNCNYPPFYPTVLSFLPSIHEWWYGVPGLNPHLIHRVPQSTNSPHARAHARVTASAQLLKLPAMLADVAITVLILAWVWARGSALRAVVAAGLWVINPVSIYNSAYFGQVDAIHSLWMLAALLAAVEEHAATAWTFTALALLTKLQAIVIVPVIAILTVQPALTAFLRRDHEAIRQQLRRLLVASLAAGIVAWIILAPFIRAGTLHLVRKVYANSVSETNNARTTVTAHNLWWLLLDARPIPRTVIPRDDRPLAGPFTARHLGYALFVLLTATACLALATGSGRCTALLAAAVIGLGFFLLSTQMKARYGFAGMVLTMPLIVCGYRYVFVTAILSATLLLNGADVLKLPDGFLHIAGLVNALGRFEWTGHGVAAVNLLVLGYLLFELTGRARREQRLVTGVRSPQAGA